MARFMELTGPVQPRLLRLARTLCRDPDQAADLTQECLVRAFRAFASYREGEPVLPWLMRILRNLHLDQVKSGRARYEVPGQRPEGEDLISSFAAPGPSPLETVERRQLAQWVEKELQALEPHQQQVLILCDVEELSYEEAAALVGVPVGTIRSRLSRARDALRRRLQAIRADRPDK